MSIYVMKMQVSYQHDIKMPLVIPILCHYPPVLSRAPKIQSWYMELSMLSSGGGSMKWKRSKS